MTRIEQWLMGWAYLADSIVCIVTFTAWRRNWGAQVTIWSLKRRAHRGRVFA